MTDILTDCTKMNDDESDKNNIKKSAGRGTVPHGWWRLSFQINFRPLSIFLISSGVPGHTEQTGEGEKGKGKEKVHP